MQLLHVAGAVLNQTPLDWNGNRDRIIACIESARQQNVDILCLPELCISGYGCEDAFQSPDVRRLALVVLQEIVPHTRGMIVSLGLPLFHQNAVYNTACLVADGKILGFVGKRFLAGDGIHYEPRWFKPWPPARRAAITIDGQEYPLGDLHFDVGGAKFGFEICEDAWVANRPGGELAQRGVDILLNPSASHFAFAKNEVRQRFVLEGSRAFGVTYIYANLLGNEAGRAIYDGGVLIASDGKMVASGARFSFTDFGITSAAVDLDATRLSRARSGSYQPELDSSDALLVRVPHKYPARVPEVVKLLAAHWESSDSVKEEEFSRAVALGLFDYMRKSRSHGFVVSISGGADSAAVSTLVALAVRLGVAELGLQGFCDKLDYLPELKSATNEREIVHRLLICIYQATRNSGAITLNAARAVAEGVGAEFVEFDVDALVQGYKDLAVDAIGRPLQWERDDVALQNIQARVRSPSVWMLANLRNALLLSTSNRSEAAVGYATMDGDTSGGLSPIAGIDKAFLRHWLRWYETRGPEGIGPLPALAAVNLQEPTAELRPPDAKQTDEADLMPYELLDAIERHAIRDKRSPLEAYQLLRVEFVSYAPRDLLTWVERFFRLWCRNQWKRERYAPSFHLDDENLDPKTWCRFPILSGGYQRELTELRTYVDANRPA